MVAVIDRQDATLLAQAVIWGVLIVLVLLGVAVTLGLGVRIFLWAAFS